MLIRTIVLAASLGAAVAWMVSAPARETQAPSAMTVDGGRYYGPLSNGKLHGRGRIEWDNGAHYEGSFVRGYFSGHGRRRYATGHIYEGQFEQGLMHGTGRFDSPEGETYEGDFVRDKFTGKGRLKRKDGSSYEGQFENWRLHGAGRYDDGQGYVYEGYFVHGDLTGRGKLTGKDTGHYEGEFKNWRFHGQGELRLPNGDHYIGAFADGVYEGPGTLTYAKARPDGRTEDRGLWRNGELEDKPRELQARFNVEAALYNQRGLLDAALRALSAPPSQQGDLYLLAVGGDGSQEVFRREVDFVTTQFAQLFGTQGRSVSLINSRHTVATHPMATITSLSQSLDAIAARMNKERDILFLFITSHGSKEHEITLNQPAMRLRDLPARELGRLVRESGVRWKVVLLSACYSGGFIDELKDDHTLIITAARHDRRSFGCSDDNDFTYFGRAFFKESLPLSGSFQEAFQRAKKLVSKWEHEDLKDTKDAAEEYSLPQMVSGAAIEHHLDQWWGARGRTQRTAGMKPPQ